MDELLSKRMPYSAEAEQSVLGSMLIDARCVPEVLELVSPKDFYVPENVKIFETLYSMFALSKPIDPITVLDELKLAGVYDDAGGRAYLMSLIDITPTSANVARYAAIVRDKALIRSLAEISGEIYENAITGEAEASVILEKAEQRIYSLRRDHSGKGLVHIRSVIYENYKKLDELARNGGVLPGLTTGFSTLDTFLAGLSNSDLILIAARPGMGKTSLALNIAQSAAIKTGKDVAVFNLEMSREQLVLRMLSSEALIDSKRLRTAELNDKEWDKLAHATATLGGAPIYIDDTSSINTNEIKARCRRLGTDLGLVVIDYLQLMQSTRRTENRVQEVSDISRALKIMAKELDVPVICLSQLSRAPEGRQDKRPMLSDLRDSGAIEQDADIVIFLYRDDYYHEDSETRNICELIIAKNRHGETGTVDLQWLGQFTKFSTQDVIHNEASHR